MLRLRNLSEAGEREAFFALRRGTGLGFKIYWSQHAVGFGASDSMLMKAGSAHDTLHLAVLTGISSQTMTTAGQAHSLLASD